MIQANKVGERLESRDIDLLVASTPENVFHSSGAYTIATTGLAEPGYALWSRSAGGPYLVLPSREMSCFIDTDSEPLGVYPYGKTNIYRGDTLSEHDQKIVRLEDSRSFDGAQDALVTAIEELADGPTVAIEEAGFTPSTYESVQSELDGYTFEQAQAHFHHFRRVKSLEEIERLRKSAEITEAAMEGAMDLLEPGMTEWELATEWRRIAAEKGGEPINGFLTVGFGDRTAYTHPLPGDREIEPGDLVRWDGGCRYKNYCSDIGRTFAFREAADDHKAKYEALYAGLEAATAAIHDGSSAQTVFETGVEAVKETGPTEFEQFEPFHLGHGIGVEIYDPPTIAPGDATLQENMVMCVEPPYNELGSGGFLIEDELRVTNDGVDFFTNAAETLPIIE